MARPGFLRRSTFLVLPIAALALIGAQAAQAEVICVNRAGAECDVVQADTGSIGAQLLAAIKHAADSATDDQILLGAGTYDAQTTFYYTKLKSNSTLPSNGTLEIQGPASGTARLKDTGSTAQDETIEGRENSGALTLRKLTIEGPPNADRSLGTELGAPGSVVDEVRYVVSGGTQVPTAYESAILARADVTLTHVTISGFVGGLATRPVASADGAANPAKLTVSDTTIVVSGLGIQETAEGADFSRVTITSPAGPGVNALGSTTVANSVIDVGSGQAVATDCDGNTALRFVTIRGGASGLSSGCADSGGNASLVVINSILVPGTKAVASGSGSISLENTRWDGPATSGVTAGSGMTTASPLFVSGTDFHLQAEASPLIDAVPSGDLGSTSGGDRDGANRKFGAQADLGAYELQSTPGGPTPTPTPTPIAPTPTPTPGSPTPTPTPATPTPTPTPNPTSTPAPNPTPTPGTAATPTPTAVPPAPPVPTATPAPGVTPTPFRTPIYTGVKLPTGKLRIDRKGRLAVKLSCPSGGVGKCTGTVQLVVTSGKGKKAKTTVLGKAKVTLTPGASPKSITIMLSKAARKLVRGSGLKATLRATTTGSGGGAATTNSKPVTVQPPKH